MLKLYNPIHKYRVLDFLINREEIEKQKAKERYMKMHLAGKTDQAKADLARLAIIRKQREEAAKKKEEEKKGKPIFFWYNLQSSIIRSQNTV